MKNKELLYGLLGVAVLAGFYFWNKNQKQKTYSKECWDSLNRRLEQEDAKRPNFEKDFLESCAKSEKNKIVLR
jgi:hypothetical protein